VRAPDFRLRSPGAILKGQSDRAASMGLSCGGQADDPTDRNLSQGNIVS
jgi:hypothetical protein